MNLIVPMAGMGKRLRPHTLTIPKPLLPIAGKTIVQRLVEDIAQVSEESIEEIAFVIGKFGDEVESQLKKIAADIGAAPKIYYQDEALGTAHAILCAKSSLVGKTIVAFADTLFQADFSLDEKQDGIIWVKKIEDPRAFGVVKLNDDNIITDFVEKPDVFVSDLAIIGIYYFKDGNYLKEELEYVIDNDIKDKGEYQLTTALENMKQKGVKFSPGKVDEWLDCGNKDSTVFTNERVLEYNGNLINDSVQYINSEVIPPCFIGANAIIRNSKIGPHVSLGSNTVVENSVINKTIIQNDSMITNAKLSNSMIGNHVNFDGKNTQQEVSIGDFSEVK